MQVFMDLRFGVAALVVIGSVILMLPEIEIHHGSDQRWIEYVAERCPQETAECTNRALEEYFKNFQTRTVANN